MKKISMPNPIAELDGDEMTRIIWAMIKDELIKPFVELNTEYYDLSIQNRENTKGRRKVRHHNPEFTAPAGVSPDKALALSQRHHTRCAGRHGIPRAHTHFKGKAGGVLLEKAHHNSPPCLWRYIQGC